MAPIMSTKTLFASISMLASSAYARSNWSHPLRVETHVNTGTSSNMVSSLIIGSQAAMLVDLPLAIAGAEELVAWIKNTTDKPLVAAFSSHFHPDHFLSGGAVLDAFPGVQYLATPNAAADIEVVAPHYVAAYTKSMGADAIVQDTALPTIYNHSFITLPGDEGSPIFLLDGLTGDTIDETLFWIPSISTLIACDAIFNDDFHIWLADQRTPEMTASWLATLDLIDSLGARTVIPGHSGQTGGFAGKAAADYAYTRKYIEFWAQKVQPKGDNYFTQEQIVSLFVNEFGELNSTAESPTILQYTAAQHGINGSRVPEYITLTGFTNLTTLTDWIL